MTIYPPALAAHLEKTVTTLCQCWRLTRRDGTVLGFTDHDRALTVDGTPFEPQTGFTASEARTTLGLGTDTQDIEGALSSARLDGADIEAGLFDGATVETLLVNWRQPTDFARLRKAVVGRIVTRDGSLVAELESMAQSLDQPNGRTVARRCDAELGDGRCRFDLGRPGFSASGAVLTLDAPDTVLVSGLGAFAAGWFANGRLTWTSGAAATSSDRVIAHAVRADGVALTLWRERPAAPVPGDRFSLVAGCDKRFETCRKKFDNVLNFRGFPHLPGNDAAYGYVTEDGAFDGGPLVP